MVSKKILLIASEFPPNVGGIGNHAYNLSKALANEGYEVVVLADIIDVTEEEQQIFSKQQPFYLHFVPRKRNVLLTYINRVSKAYSLAKDADIIVCSGKFSLWLGMLLRITNKRKKFVAVVHGTELDLRSGIPRKLTYRSLFSFNTIISVSAYTQKYLPRKLPASIQKVVIHNGVNMQEFAGTVTGDLAGEPALITVGNVTPRKGQENVINAMPVIQQLFPQTKYHIVGKPTFKDQLVKRCKQLRLNGTVKFHGAVDRSELLNSLSSSKIKLMLSNHTDEGDFEGFGIAVLEANAYGVPAIGSKNSGIEDAIVHNNTGILVDPTSPRDIADAVNTILANYDFYSANARKWAELHDWKNIVLEYKKVLN